MGTTELTTSLPVRSAYHAAPVLALDADFDTRWAAWLERGRVHEQRVRRKFVVWAGVLTLAAAMIYAFLRL
jgi:hypothetical protein